MTLRLRQVRRGKSRPVEAAGRGARQVPDQRARQTSFPVLGAVPFWTQPAETIKFPRKQPWSIWRIVSKASLAPHFPSPQGPRASSPAVAESSLLTDGGARLISPLNQD